ncbi:MAG: hypothetical protein ACYCVY_12930, partial [Acidiferrobacteraceae bacterium]
DAGAPRVGCVVHPALGTAAASTSMKRQRRSEPFKAKRNKQFTTTRGTWMKLEKSAVDRLLFPDPDKLSDEDWKKVEKAWESAASSEWPALIDQLKNGSPRAKVDESFMDLLGSPKERAATIRNGTLAVLESLQTAMKGD